MICWISSVSVSRMHLLIRRTTQTWNWDADGAYKVPHSQSASFSKAAATLSLSLNCLFTTNNQPSNQWLIRVSSDSCVPGVIKTLNFILEGKHRINLVRMQRPITADWLAHDRLVQDDIRAIRDCWSEKHNDCVVLVVYFDVLQLLFELIRETVTAVQHTFLNIPEWHRAAQGK